MTWRRLDASVERLEIRMPSLLISLHRAVAWGRTDGSETSRPSITPRAGSLAPPRRAESTRSRWSRRQRALAGLVIATLLGTAAVSLSLSQTDARRQLEARFELRVGLGTSFVRSYLDDISARAHVVGVTYLSAPQVSALDFAGAARGLGFGAAVLLDETGALLQVLPEQPALIGTDLAARYLHLRRALEGRTAVSDVVPGAADGAPLVAIATPFDTPSGRRVVSGGYHLSHTPLTAYLAAAIPFSAGEVFLVDGGGVLVATNDAERGAGDLLADAQPALMNAMSARSNGVYSDEAGAHYFAAESIPGTTLRLVATVPSESLYQPLSGPVQWVPWIVLGCLAVGTIYLLRLLLALSATQLRLRIASVELERSNRELQDFASIASHDLQEPLRKIQAFGERLGTSSADVLDDESQDYLARMQQAALRMQTLIQELLAYSRVASMAPSLQKLDLTAVVNDVLTDLEERVNTSGGRVEVGALPTITAGPVQMRQVFQNLIANALKFHRDGVPPVIRIESAPADRGRAWEIMVTDNGIGFDEKYLDRIFAPFERLHGRQAYEGTGMGLAIVRRIAESNGGSVTATSQPGEGATFLITLPAN
ncbi:hypothetical protein BH23CHL6_BH23CHL6_06170 [soil metagenome]